MNVFEVGQIVGGKYRVQRLVGRGGMGIVVEAEHLVLSARVAIKVLVPELAQNPEAVGRFLREARTTFGIRSPHVVTVLDVGHTDTGLPFIVMEYLEGEDVGARLQRLGRMPVPEAVEIVRQAALGVAYAHGQGIIHRDLKPSNLFCEQNATGELVVKVVDFGISKLTSDSPLGQDNLVSTHTAAILGSPLYMAPEQLQSAKHLDEGCDIWSLGVILFELLVGRPPFLGTSVTEVAINVATQPMPALNEFRSDVPPPLQAVVTRCLRKSRAERYPTVDDLLAALRDGAVTAGSTHLGSRTQGALQPPPERTADVGAAERAAPVPTLTLEGLPAVQSPTHAPLSSTQAPEALTKRKRTRLVSAAGAVTSFAAIAFVVTRTPPDESAGNAASASQTSYLEHTRQPETALRETAPPETALPETARPTSAPAQPSRSMSVSPKPPEGNSQPLTIPKKPVAPALGSVPPRPSPAAPPKSAPACVPYYLRNGVRVFNDACILEHEAQRGRPSAADPTKVRNP